MKLVQLLQRWWLAHAGVIGFVVGDQGDLTWQEALGLCGLAAALFALWMTNIITQIDRPDDRHT